MDTNAAIYMLREKVKALAVKQRPLKRARKTSIVGEERSKLIAEAELDWKPSSPWGSHVMATIEVHRRRASITAAINLSHELRGSKHQHGHGDEYLYERAINELRKGLMAEK